MDYKYFELIVTCILKKELYFNETNNFLSYKINKSMLLDDQLKDNHEKYKYKYKFYTFKSFYPLEKDKIYKNNKVYLFTIRCLEDDFAEKIKKCLIELKDDEMEVLSVEKRNFSYEGQLKFKTITPIVVTMDNKPWKLDDGNLDDFISRIQNNLLKKYKDIFGEEPDIDGYFIENFTIDKKPSALKYKNIKLIGYKIRFSIFNDEVSKKLAFIALAAGLGEKNSAIGAGYCEVI